MIETTTDTRISKLEIEISALREKVGFFTIIYDKFDTTLEKLQEMVESRRDDTKDDLKDVYSKIEGVQTKIMYEIESMREEMKRQHEVENKKIDDLNKWRWLVMGGAAVIGWILSKVAHV
ncbi:hypothetical protein UFOVP49_117 [uncultured Caudovirales phage]|uniref:DUF7201 domain-containing protein n=1 Tax=uncultured Caudovirales phage TaxID=2100421 RepID=A0A6J5KWD1_9CAUD|nr:hypothetical protein UFOVP49_117 [uncultured Caudovirales phage]